MLASELIKTYEEFYSQELSLRKVMWLADWQSDKEIQKVMVTGSGARKTKLRLAVPSCHGRR